MTDLPKLFYGEGAFANVEHILEGLTPRYVNMRPYNVPHTIYEELWHIAYWKALLLTWAQDQPATAPEHDREGWPGRPTSVGEAVWQGLVRDVLAEIETARDLAANPETFRRVVSDGKYTAQGALEALVVHNAYHFGQIVLLRQLLDLWPPPSGGDSW